LLWKKTYTYFIAIVLFIGSLLLLWCVQPKTPLRALEKYAENVATLRYSTMIKTIDIDSEESLLFYFNDNQNLDCAVIRKRFGFYKVVNISAELARDSSTLRVGMFGSGFVDNGINKALIWGIIYDTSVKKVTNDNGEISRFSTPDFDMFYSFNNPLEFEFGSYHFYDALGNELPLALADDEMP